MVTVKVDVVEVSVSVVASALYHLTREDLAVEDVADIRRDLRAADRVLKAWQDDQK